MNETKTYGIVGVLALIAIISSIGVNLPDFFSGLILGVGIALEIISIYKIAKSLKENKNN